MKYVIAIASLMIAALFGNAIIAYAVIKVFGWHSLTMFVALIVLSAPYYLISAQERNS